MGLNDTKAQTKLELEVAMQELAPNHVTRQLCLQSRRSNFPIYTCNQISVGFRTYDIHSGVRSIEWRLIDNDADTVVELGSEAVAVFSISEDTQECDDPATCVCIPSGDCYAVAYGFKPTFPNGVRDRDYFITLTVTNHAGLVTNETIMTMVTSDNVGAVAESLATLTNDTSLIDDSVVASTADILDIIVNTEDTSPEVTANVVMVVNNLLQVDDMQFGDTEATANSSSRIVKSLGRQISNVLAAGRNVTLVTNSLAVVAMNFPPSSLADGVGFAAISGENGTDSLNEDQIYVYDSDREIPVEQVAVSIQLPAEILDQFPAGSQIPVSFIVYQNTKLFRSQQIGNTRSSSSPSFIDSGVISATVEGARIENLPADAPVVTSFLQRQMMKNNSNSGKPDTECVFWDFNLRDGIGDWSTEGCERSSPVDGRTICHCDHTTNFAVLVSIHGPAKYASFALDIFSKIGCSVSIVALIITIFIYTAIKSLRATTASRILVSFCSSLLLLYIVFLAGIEQTSSRVGCIIAAVLMHYFVLTSMAWMGVEATNLYLKLVRVVSADVEHFMIKASIAAWGIPMLVIIVILAVDYTVYENEDSCFLKPGAAFYYGELLIIGLVFLFNVVIFVLVFRKLTCSTSKIQGSSDENRRGKIARRLQNMASISVLLGLTWVFGLLSVFDSTAFTFQVLFCVFNSCQGLFIFLLFVVRQDKIRGYVSNLVRGRRAAFTDSSTTDTRLASLAKTVESSVRCRQGPDNHVEASDQESPYEDMEVGFNNGGSASASKPHIYDEVAIG